MPLEVLVTGKNAVWHIDEAPMLDVGAYNIDLQGLGARSTNLQ